MTRKNDVKIKGIFDNTKKFCKKKKYYGILKKKILKWRQWKTRVNKNWVDR